MRSDRAIFPIVEVEPGMAYDSLHCDGANFKNYAGVEESEVTEKEIRAHLEKGHIISFDTLEDLGHFVKGEPILNKLGLITKVRNGISKTLYLAARSPPALGDPTCSGGN